jgi:hypothetical protein
MLLALICAAAAAAPAEQTAALGRLWGEVRTFHPQLAGAGIDWDGALERTLQAKEPFAQAARRLLAETHDPSTRLLGPAKPHPVRSEQHWESDGVLVVSVGLPSAQSDLAGEVRALLPKTRTLIIDLRDGDLLSVLNANNVLQALRDELSPREFTVPSRRSLLHSGFRASEAGFGDYFTHWQETPPGKGAAGKNAPKRLIFIVDDRGQVSDLVVALQQGAGATVIAETSETERWLVPSRLIDLPDGAQAVVRSAQLVFGNKAGGKAMLPRADAIAAKGAGLQLALTGGAVPPRPALAEPVYEAAWRPDADPSSGELPTREQRLLALFRYTAAIRHFFGYPELLTADWDRAILEAIPALDSAKNAFDYQIALRKLLHHLPDGHGSLAGTKALDGLLGTSSSVRTMLVEGRLAVVWAAPDSGAHISDEVISFEGKPIAERLEWLFQIARGSSDQARRHYAAERALFGGANTNANVELRGADGKLRKLSLKHGPFYVAVPQTGEPVQIKEGNVGYLDLRHLSLDDIPGAIEKVRKTRGLVIDLRGYPNGGAWPLSGWLNVRGAKAGNIYQRAQVISGVVVDGDVIGESMMRFTQPIPPSPVPDLYTGKVAVLIDEQAQSQSEHSCLFLEVAAAPVFVGSPTIGADGDVTAVSLPGGLLAWFSGQGVLHADGRPLQGIGIIPDVPVPVTFAGLRAGRDEAMDRALDLLRQSTRDK